MPYRTVMRTVPTFMGLGLVGENIAFATKKGGAKVKDILGIGVKNLVGVPLIGNVADLITGL